MNFAISKNDAIVFLFIFKFMQISRHQLHREPVHDHLPVHTEQKKVFLGHVVLKPHTDLVPIPLEPFNVVLHRL